MKKRKAEVADGETIADEAVQVSTDAATDAQPAGLEIYWKLSAADAITRETAAVALVKELIRAQATYDSMGEERGAEAVLLGGSKEEEGLRDCAPAVRYALRRLVRGLASSHGCARQGFALAFTAVMESLSGIKVDAMMKLIRDNIEASSSMKGQEIRDGLLGRLFAFASIIRAGRFISNNSTSSDQELIKELAQQLLTLAKKKSFLREPATVVLLELADKLPSQSLEASLFTVPQFKDWIQAEADVGGADVLLLLLKLNVKLPGSLRTSSSLLPKSGNMVELFTPDFLTQLVPYLKEASYSHPRVHPVWQVLFDILLSLDGQQSRKKRKGKKDGQTLAKGNLNIVEESLKAFWTVVIDDSLLTSSHERKHLAMQIVLMLLPQIPTSCIEIVLSKAFLCCLVDVLSSKNNLLYKSAQQFVADLCKWASNGDKQLIPIIACLQKCSQLSFDSVPKATTVKVLLRRILSLSSCSFDVHTLESILIPLIRTTSEEDSTIILKLQSAISKISSLINLGKNEDIMKRLQAMLSLLTQLMYEAWLEPGTVTEMSMELLICCQKAFGQQIDFAIEMEESPDGSPDINDVVLDVVLSLLASSSAPVRTAAEELFKVYCNDITPSGLNRMLQVVRKEVGRSRHKSDDENKLVDDNNDDDLVGFEDESADEDGEIDEDGEPDEDVDDETVEEDSEDETVKSGQNATQMHTMKGNMQNKTAMVQDADNNGADSSDDAEVSDLDDEAMFKLDSHLAEIFKERKKGLESKTGIHVQLSVFKLRVLGLLEIFLQKNSGNTLVLTVLPSLLQAFINSCSTDDKNPLASKLENIMRSKILKGKEYPKGTDIDRESLDTMLQKTLRIASRYLNKRIRDISQACWFWFFKVKQANFPSTEEGSIVQTMSTAIEEVFTSKRSRLSCSFFTELFSRYSWLAGSLVGKLIEQCKSARDEYLRSEALNLIALALKLRNPRTQNGMHGSLKPYLSDLSELLVMLVEKPFKKQQRRAAAFHFCVTCLEALRTLYADVSLGEIINVNQFSSALQKLSVPEKGKVRSSLVRLQHLLSSDGGKGLKRPESNGDTGKKKKKTKVAKAA